MFSTTLSGNQNTRNNGSKPQEINQNCLAFENIFNKANEFWMKLEEDDADIGLNSLNLGGQSSIAPSSIQDKELSSPRQGLFSDSMNQQSFFFNDSEVQNGSQNDQFQTRNSAPVQYGEQQSSCQSEVLRRKSNSMKIKKQSSGCSSSKSSKSYKRSKFTSEEDSIVIKKIQQFGKNWEKIAEFLPGKNENMVRNRYYVKIRPQIEKNKSKSNSSFAAEQKITSDAGSISFQHAFEDTQADYSSNTQNDQYTGSNFLSPQIQKLPITDCIDQQQQQEFSNCFLNNNMFQGEQQLKRQQSSEIDMLAPIQEEFLNFNNNDIAKMIQEEQNEYDEKKKRDDIFVDPPLMNFEEDIIQQQNQNNKQKSKQSSEKPFYFNSSEQNSKKNIMSDDVSVVDEATEMPQYKNVFMQNHLNQQLKMNKIEFLQNQVKHIEEMILSCRNQIMNKSQISNNNQNNNCGYVSQNFNLLNQKSIFDIQQ